MYSKSGRKLKRMKTATVVDSVDTNDIDDTDDTEWSPVKSGYSKSAVDILNASLKLSNRDVKKQNRENLDESSSSSDSSDEKSSSISKKSKSKVKENLQTSCDICGFTSNFKNRDLCMKTGENVFLLYKLLFNFKDCSLKFQKNSIASAKTPTPTFLGLFIIFEIFDCKIFCFFSNILNST